ncbi:MAG: hypothetical protein F6K09_39150, partial [Merismopedia sp. SIO2A8]|nr:hypothetical protein [Merismopedia sp. SIO2A8]
DSFEPLETSQPLLETIAVPDTVVGQPENTKIPETILQTSQHLELSENSCQTKEQGVVYQAFMKTLEDFRRLTFLISQGTSASSEKHLISK